MSGYKLLYTPILASLITVIGFSQQRPGLFFREDWKEIPAEVPITQKHVANPELELRLYGAAAECVKKSHHDKPADDPYYVWSGLCEADWAVALRHRTSNVDLRGLAKIRWRTKQSGFRQLRIILKLTDGTWLVSDQFDDASTDWRIREFNLQDIRWRKLNIETIVEEDWVENPDLSQVEEIGWTELMRGGRSMAFSRLDWIEVYGQPVPRTKANVSQAGVP